MDLNDLSYARCKACDTRFYPSWREERGCFEDLCSTCIKEAFMLNYYSNEDEEYIKQVMLEYQEVDDDYT